MGYCNKIQIQNIIAQALTTASPNDLSRPVDLLSIGNTFDTNVIPDDVVDQYVTWADEEIDAAFSELYTTPFCEAADFETPLLADINEYNPYVITSKRCPFNLGDTIILTDSEHEERHTIDEIVNDVDRNVFGTEEVISYYFLAEFTRVIRVKFPTPITLMSTRLSAANIYDKYFASQSSPNESKFGQYLRAQARQDINNVLNGRTILYGQHRIGRRFYNATLVDRYGLPPGPGAADNNIDDLGRS